MLCRLLPLLMALLCASPLAAQFSSITVFGDSLSDVGNVNSATFGVLPGSDYFDGRFSNGPVYSELLAERLGLPELLPSTDDGSNYAYGGARTTGTSFFDGGLFIDDLDEQVDDYLANTQPGEEELIVVLAGGNDFVLAGATKGDAIAQRVVREIERLIDAGARNILSVNLPPLGDVPRGGSNQESWNARSAAYNAELSRGLDELATSPDLTIYELNLEELFGVLLENLQDFGFTNSTQAAINLDDANGFVFWDDLHPTTAAHQLLAEAAFLQLQGVPAFGGDFNLDGHVDRTDVDLLGLQLSQETQRLSFDVDQDGVLTAQDLSKLLEQASRINGDADFDGVVGFADFVVLSNNFGREGPDLRWSQGNFDSDGEVGFLDFITLSLNFDQTANASAPVPEPSCEWLWLAFALIASTCRRRIKVHGLA